jgi:Putative DNA-binding domain
MNEKNTDLLRRLLEQRESHWLDFKETHHDNKVALVHDILCLANSDAETNRYLVFGVDDTRKVKGITADPNRRRQADLYDLISAWRLNVVPALRLFTADHSSGLEVDILEIENRPEKPYFVLEDKVDRGKVLRAGVVYSRLADRNTPVNSCVDDKKLERMFLERFALHLTPNERFRRYIQDIEGWQTKETFNAFYRAHPEFTLREKERDELQPYDEPWVKTFPDPKGYRYEIEARYFGTTIDEFFVVSCDGGRFYCVQPSLRYAEGEEHYYWFYFHIRGSLQHDAYLFFRRGVTDFRGYKEPFALLESEADVEDCFVDARNGVYCDGMYLLKKDSRKFFWVARDGKLREIYDR